MLWRPASAVARLDVLVKDGLTAEGHCSETEGSVEKATTKRKSARIAERNNKVYSDIDRLSLLKRELKRNRLN
ncbi:hypothetical protein Bhyg_09666 [Pseudolycoriella hygida]|uniref:Uncharacterized protein n=1 Tax=Pseudolycoriella hygida TaxID=35572 RepID=A0A9Q0MRY0_9DIPT|nr:hypothetical protein Bhyg_09666 [Pseudolycoriella hygida]